MKLLVYRDGNTEVYPIESLEGADTPGHEARSLVIRLVTGATAVLKLETAADIAQVVKALQG